MSESDWQPIETAPMYLFDHTIILLRDENGHEAEGSWGWDDESWDSETGEEIIYGAWHKGDDVTERLGFEPTHWKPISELP